MLWVDLIVFMQEKAENLMLVFMPLPIIHHRLLVNLPHYLNCADNYGSRLMILSFFPKLFPNNFWRTITPIYERLRILY